MLRILREEAAAPKSYWVEMSLAEADTRFGQWCGWLYFPVDEGQKVRACMDCRELNLLSVLPETCWMPGVDGVVDLVRLMARTMGPEELRFAREDWANGFRQLRLREQDKRFLCAVAWDASKSPGEELRVFSPRMLMFGPRPGPSQFCRTSAGLVEVANVYLAICCVVHVDDTIIVDTSPELEHARRCFVSLAGTLQCEQKEAKAFPPRGAGGASCGPCLGVLLELPDRRGPGDVVCKLSIPDDKKEKYVADLNRMLSSDSLLPGAAAKLVGRLEWAASACFGRAARSFLWPLRDRQRGLDQGGSRLSPALRAAGQALVGFVKQARGLSFRSSDAGRETVVGCVDASSAGHSACLGGVLITDVGGAFFVAEVGERLRRWLPEGSSSVINEAEALAALVWLQTFGRHLQGTDVLLFLDSEAAEGSLLSGYSKNRNLTAISGAFWTLSASRQIRVWIGRVSSRLNPSDGVSRRDRTWVEAQGWREMRPVDPPVAPWRFLLEGGGEPPPRARRRQDARRVRNQGQ